MEQVVKIEIARRRGGSSGKESDDRYYYPFWIGTVIASMERLFVKPREIRYQVVCNAIKEEVIVLRAIPQTRVINARKDKVLSCVIPECEFTERIMKTAQKERIDKQFMFGEPDKKSGDIRLIYIPVIKKTDGDNEYYINELTGQVI